MRIQHDATWEGRKGDRPRNGVEAWVQQPSEAVPTPGPEEAGDRAASRAICFELCSAVEALGHRWPAGGRVGAGEQTPSSQPPTTLPVPPIGQAWVQQPRNSPLDTWQVGEGGEWV